MSETRRLVVALVRGLRGLDGVVRVEVLTDGPEVRFAMGGELFVEGATEPLVIRLGKPVDDGPGWWLAFDRHPDRSSVERLRGRYLEAEVALDAVRAAGAALWDEVIGSAVRDLAGRELGRVDEVYRAGGAEVYVVRGGPLGDFDLPAVRDFIHEFEPARGVLVIDAAALDLEASPPARPARAHRPPRWSRHGADRPDATTPAAQDEG